MPSALTQAQLARKMDCTPQELGKYRRGERRPGMWRTLQLQALGVCVECWLTTAEIEELDRLRRGERK